MPEYVAHMKLNNRMLINLDSIMAVPLSILYCSIRSIVGAGVPREE
jgi:hypothetical protein